MEDFSQNVDDEGIVQYEALQSKPLPEDDCRSYEDMLSLFTLPVSVQNFTDQDGNRAFGYLINSVYGFYKRITSDAKLEKIELDACSNTSALFHSDYEQSGSVYEV